MRVGILLLASAVLAGCAAAPPTKMTSEPVAQLAAYEESPSVALVFESPTIGGQRNVQLTRDERQPAAFVGFDGPITTFFWIHTDDLQSSDGFGSCLWGGSADRFERRAIIDKFGTTSR